MGVSVPSLHRESTDSLISWAAEYEGTVGNLFVKEKRKGRMRKKVRGRLLNYMLMNVADCNGVRNSYTMGF